MYFVLCDSLRQISRTSLKWVRGKGGEGMQLEEEVIADQEEVSGTDCNLVVIQFSGVYYLITGRLQKGA